MGNELKSRRTNNPSSASEMGRCSPRRVEREKERILNNRMKKQRRSAPPPEVVVAKTDGGGGKTAFRMEPVPARQDRICVMEISGAVFKVLINLKFRRYLSMDRLGVIISLKSGYLSKGSRDITGAL